MFIRCTQLPFVWLPPTHLPCSPQGDDVGDTTAQQPWFGEPRFFDAQGRPLKIDPLLHHRAGSSGRAGGGGDKGHLEVGEWMFGRDVPTTKLADHGNVVLVSFEVPSRFCLVIFVVSLSPSPSAAATSYRRRRRVCHLSFRRRRHHTLLPPPPQTIYHHCRRSHHLPPSPLLPFTPVVAAATICRRRRHLLSSLLPLPFTVVVVAAIYRRHCRRRHLPSPSFLASFLPSFFSRRPAKRLGGK
jgi:hypothetical protein